MWPENIKELKLKMLNNTRGVSLIAAIFIIVILAFMGVVFVSMINTSTVTATNDAQSAKALYVAEGGLESAVLSLTAPSLANRIACGNITGNANFTNEPLGAGQFMLTGAAAYPAPAPAVLNGALTSAATTINVNSIAGYPQYGRIMIDRELIDYSGAAGNAFLNAVRGRDGTTAAAHAIGTRVGQYQCSITSQGGIPSVTTPAAMRTVAEGVQLQEGWIVGAAGGVGFRPLYVRFNGLTWNLFAPASVTNVQMNSISMLSYADGWAVGNNGGAAGGCPNTNGRIFRWNGISWSCVASPSNQTLNSVYMVSANQGWAVGVSAGGGGGACTNNRARILRWNGTAWNCVASPSNQNLNAVYMLDTNNDGVADDGWAVGVSGGGGGGACTNNRARILRWNGAAWNCVASPSNQTLNSVYMVSANDGWAVGVSGGGGGGACTNNRARILRWNGAAWNCVASPSNQTLNSVYMVSANDGWAVGNRLGAASNQWTIFRWNVPVANTWNQYIVNTAPIGAQTLRSVACINPNDCWAVGDAGARLHWDGTAWSAVNVPAIAQALRSVSLIGPKQRPQSAWREVP